MPTEAPPVALSAPPLADAAIAHVAEVATTPDQTVATPVLESATTPAEQSAGPSLPSIPAAVARPPAPEAAATHNIFNPAPGAVTATLPSRRIQNVVGSTIRTLVVAGLIAALVFGGRYAWQWNQDREAGGSAALPTEPVAPIAAKFASIVATRETPTSSGETRAAIEVDLGTGDLLVTVGTTLGDVSIARRDGVFLVKDAAAVWAPMSPELISTYSWTMETLAQAAVLTISDVIPTTAYPYVTVVSDAEAKVPGSEFVGEQIIDVGESDRAQPSDSDGRISTSGNSDPFLDGTLDDVVNPALEEQADNPKPAVSEVAVRHLILSVDRDAMAAADPHLAVELDFDQPGTVQIELWVDRTGSVRKMIAPDGASRYGGVYELVGASSVGAGPLAGVDFSGAPQTEEGQP